MLIIIIYINKKYNDLSSYTTDEGRKEENLMKLVKSIKYIYKPYCRLFVVQTAYFPKGMFFF